MSDSGTLWYRAVRAFVRSVIFRALGGVRVVHADRVPPRGPLIIAPVHLSFLDPPLVAVAMPRAISFMAKEELFRPGFGRLIRSLGAFPVRRGAGDLEAIRLAMDLLGAGRAVLMFPEGTRGGGEIMGTLTPGVGMLAKRSGAAVVPVGIAGTQKVLPKGASKPRRAPMTLVFGEPLSYADFGTGRGEREAFMRELERRIVAACAEAGLLIRTAASVGCPQTSPDPAPPSGLATPAE